MGPQTFISFALFLSLGSLGTTLGKPRRAYERPHMTLPWHECASNGPGTGASVPEPRRAHINPRFFQFSGHFSTSLSPTSFSVPDLRRVTGVPEDCPWGLRLTFHSHFCLPLARLARP